MQEERNSIPEKEAEVALKTSVTLPAELSIKSHELLL